MARAELPLFDLARRYASRKAEYDRAIARFLEGQWFTLGPALERFEAEFARYLGTQDVVGVANGTDALELALEVLGVGPGDEVITVANTFVATVAAIRRVGARPVFVDVDRATYCMDPTLAKAAVTSRTRAIVPVHLYGHPAPMKELKELATARDLWLVEDAAQAHGASIGNRKAGAWGDVSCFSFYPTKNIGGMGDGGAVATSDGMIAERLRMLRHHGQREHNRHEVVGRNSRLDEFQATVLRVALRHLDADTARRNRLAKRYRARLADVVDLPPHAADVRHAYHLFVVAHARRDALRAALKANGVQTGIHYPTPVHRQPFWDSAVPRLPVTDALAPRIVSLPMFPELRPAEVDRVSDLVAGSVEAFSRKGRGKILAASAT